MGIQDRLRVVEIIQPLKSGYTQPYQCRLEDERLYAVKGRNALPQGLLAEACSAVLGQTMGLPIPEFALADIPAPLIASSNDPDVASSLGFGLGFASLWQDACEPVTPAIRDRQSPNFLASLYAFDHWVANGDRSLGLETGNPNLLYRLKDREVVVFDHNLAFDGNYVPGELISHAGRRSWMGVGRQPDFRASLRERMAIARARLNEVEGHLPDEWLDELPNFLANADAILDRYQTTNFWTELG